MNKFFNFEKQSLIDFVAKRKSVDILNFIDETDLKAINSDLKYGNIDYLDSSIVFLPTKEDTKVIIMNVVLGNESPKKLFEGLLEKIEYPYQIAIGKSFLRLKLKKTLLLRFLGDWFKYKAKFSRISFVWNLVEYIKIHQK